MNSAYEVGNNAHEKLVCDYFQKTIFINTKIDNIRKSEQKTNSFKSVIYKNVDEREANLIRSPALQEI